MGERQRNEGRDEKGQGGDQYVEIGDGLGGIEGKNVLREAAAHPVLPHRHVFEDDDAKAQQDEQKGGQQQPVDGPGPVPAPFPALQQDGIAHKRQAVQPCEGTPNGVTGDG